jgi:hypothetical protein
VGVEPTIRSAKERIAGFEGRENHRTFFAPAVEKTVCDYRTLREKMCGRGERREFTTEEPKFERQRFAAGTRPAPINSAISGLVQTS